MKKLARALKKFHLPLLADDQCLRIALSLLRHSLNYSGVPPPTLDVCLRRRFRNFQSELQGAVHASLGSRSTSFFMPPFCVNTFEVSAEARPTNIVGIREQI